MWHSFQWFNSPSKWDIQNDRLSVDASPNTDFWRKTHYGFIRDSGHFFYKRVSGGFVVQVRVQGDYAFLYDQGGLMLRTSDQYWMKCGIEYVDGTQQASAVVTNDFSDWSVTPLNMNPREVWFRVKRQDCSLEVFCSLNGLDYTMLRTAYLNSSRDLDVGVMCAAPEGPGFHIVFSDLSIEHATT
jgi:regulation of enolase protein 1 (concanavalin A-like superfamily)